MSSQYKFRMLTLCLFWQDLHQLVTMKLLSTLLIHQLITLNCGLKQTPLPHHVCHHYQNTVPVLLEISVVERLSPIQLTIPQVSYLLVTMTYYENELKLFCIIKHYDRIVPACQVMLVKLIVHNHRRLVVPVLCLQCVIELQILQITTYIPLAKYRRLYNTENVRTCCIRGVTQ